MRITFDFSGACVMQLRKELLGRAAECERLTGEETDDSRKRVFSLIREMWIALADESDTMNPEELGQTVAAIARIQVDFQESAGRSYRRDTEPAVH
jgi:hypothetical protein